MNKKLSGLIIGYDPGGKGHHGVAELEVKDGNAVRLFTYTKDTAEEVIQFLYNKSLVAAITAPTNGAFEAPLPPPARIT